jgi:hypothetical protein
VSSSRKHPDKYSQAPASVRRNRSGLALLACVPILAGLALTGCGATSTQPSASTPSHQRTVAATQVQTAVLPVPAGFERQYPCKSMAGALSVVVACFSRKPSLVLTPDVFLGLVRELHLTPSDHSLECPTRPRPSSPRLQVMGCHTVAARNGSHFSVWAQSLVLAGPRGARPSSRGVPTLAGGTHIDVDLLASATQ